MRFETTMFLSGNNTGIEVPPEVVESFGAGKRPLVVVTVNGFEYRSTIAPMGGMFLIPFSSDKRAATGIRGGDPIVVDLELDTAPRTVDVPDDLAAALDESPDARAKWDAFPPSSRKFGIAAVDAARRPETRATRVAKIVADAAAGKRPQ